MRCPVCGAKFEKDRCKYCHDVTAEKVLNASNLEAKKQRKKGLTENVVYSTTLPNDVSKKKLLLLTVFLGWFGAHNFYVGKNLKGLFYLVPMVLLLSLAAVSQFASYINTTTPMLVIGYVCAVVAVLWFTDIVNILFKKFKVPVVLPGNFEKDFEN